MYHEQTYAQIARRRKRYALYAALLLVIALAFGAIAQTVWGVVGRQSAESVRQAVMARAVQCMAVEGSYPASLAYLEQDYGLVVNHDDYVVVYEWLGDNVPPSVVVRRR